MGMSLTECEELARLLQIYRDELHEGHHNTHRRLLAKRTEVQLLEVEIQNVNRMDEAAIQIQKDMSFREQGSR